MNYQIEQGNFNPQSEFVDVAGTFNNWGSSLQRLADDDGDGVWSTTISGFTGGQSIEFKFRYNGAWDDREEFPGPGNNRVHTVSATDETLSFWYNDEEPPTGPVSAKLQSSSSFSFTGGSVVFTDNSSGLVEERLWTFEGGDPSSSTDKTVSVSYAEPGLYDVTLQVSNSFSSDQILLEDHIKIEDQTNADLEWWNDATFYEIFVRSFYDSDGDGIGDFNGITEKLDYLNDGDPTTSTDLGITGIWLMPIHDSPSYHGYDVNDYRSINPDYGTMDDFKNFLSEAHKRGIKVIIDLVLNHTSTEIEWFKNSSSSATSGKRNWYKWTNIKPSYNGPWGQTVWHGSSPNYYYGLFWGGMPDLNYEEEEVKTEVFDITRFWLEDVGIDGFRLDAVKFIHENDDQLEDLSETHEFWREWVAVTKQSNPNALSVGEAWTSTEKIVPYVVDNGLDFCFEFDLGSAMVNSIKNGNASSVRNQISKVINSYPYYQFGTFATNHDQNRLMNELDNSDDKVKLMAATYLTLPGIPFIYYGEEVGMLGRKPDENIRRPMSWNNNSFAGFSTSSPWISPASNYAENNVEIGMQDPNSIFNWYRKLVRLRNAEPALRQGSYSEFEVQNQSVFGFWRQLEEQKVLVLINYGNDEVVETLHSTDISGLTADQAFVDFFDQGLRIDPNSVTASSIVMKPNQVRVFTPGSLTLNTPASIEIQVYPNPTNDILNIANKSGEPLEVTLSDLKGQVILHFDHFNGTFINVENVTRGIYFLKVKRNLEEETFKVKID